MSIQESLAVFIEDPLEFPPGKGYLYTSFDFVLLSLAMERAAGKPFEALVRERVLQPLGMHKTVAEIPGNPVGNQVEFYTKGNTGFRQAAPVDTRFKLAGGGYLSTVSDVCKLGQASLEGQVMPRELSSDFLTAVEVDGTSTFYGLGWEVSRDTRGRSFYGHTGNAIGAYTNFKVFPGEQLIVAILINASTARVQPTLDAVVEALHESLPQSSALS
jgi:CubicO group peptidase (beta-lactamase class C family)